MKKHKTILIVIPALLCTAQFASAQFTPAELERRAYWESYLKTADIIHAEQPWGDEEARTNPWKLTLSKDGITRFAVWKDCDGEMRGFDESWRWEIAAYRLDKHLGLNMVPPTVERVFRGKRGSLQLWVESEWSLKKKVQKNIPTPPEKNESWQRAAWLQQAFDDLIGNEDRHMGNVLVTSDFRAILIDHSRTFRTSSRFTERLLYCQDTGREPMVMRELPRCFVENLEALDAGILQDTVGDYLTKKEIRAVLKRRALLLDWMERYATVI